MGDYESGLMKMLAIGLAKQAGADYCHAKGFGHMAETVPKFGKAIIQYSKLLFGLAIVENAYDDTYIVRAVPAESHCAGGTEAALGGQGQHEPDSDPGGGRVDRP